jgi:hypothetical protein
LELSGLLDVCDRGHRDRFPCIPRDRLHALQGPVVQLVAEHVGGGQTGRRARLAGHERHLAEDVARRERREVLAEVSAMRDHTLP